MGELPGDLLRTSFEHFARMTCEQSPLYGFLSARVAETPEMLALASGGQKRQPPPNLLFGAVQFLLLKGATHPLTAYYPSLGGTAPAEEAWPAFLDFCDRHRNEILEQVRSRRVQTNEVGRCALLLPAVALGQREMDKPLHLIEVGASAGLNLVLDRYRYEYSNGHTVGDPSPVVLRTELRGPHRDALPLPPHMPVIADRVGIDIEPVDVRDDDAMKWTEALLWPSDLSRLERYRAAVALARENPPRLVKGDGLNVVPQVVARVAAEHAPCVMHSHAIYQMDETWRMSFRAMLDELGQQRDMAHFSLEWLGDDPGPQLHLTIWKGGERTTSHLANCNPHGRWMEPVLMREGSNATSG
jgi:hypothetical protein